MKTLMTLCLLAVSAGALASEKEACGNAPRDQWMNEEAMMQKAQAQGLEVKRLKVEDNCYEVYAFDQQGRKVEAYFNPVSGDLVDTKIDD